MERDFAFVVDAELEIDKLVKAATGADKALIEAVSVFDVFAGDKAEAQMGAGKKSVAIAVRLQGARLGALTPEGRGEVGGPGQAWSEGLKQLRLLDEHGDG